MFNGDGQELKAQKGGRPTKAAPASRQPEPIRPVAESEDDALTQNDMDFSFVRPKKQKKVCIVEEDIKMTKDEIEIYNQLRDEAAEEHREAAQMFQEQMW